MITIYDQKNIDIRWEVFKVANNVHEDFSQSEIWMFLVSDEHKYPLHTTLDGNFVLARVDAGAFAPGTYSAVLMWLKNQETSKDLTRTELDNIFALTPYEEEDTSRVEGDVTVTLKSMVATYGYDGLDAYERAIMLGRFWGSEEEWMQSLGDHDLANYYTKGEVDELIENVEVDLSGYYTKEQTDTKISEAAEGLRDEIEENTDAINDVSHRVSTNTQGIADNAGSIAANTEAITENTAEINHIKSGMTTMGGRVDELETEMDNFVGLNQSNYMGMFPDVNSLPAMTEKGWAWVGSDMTAMACYVWFNATDGWTRYGSNTYDLTDYTQVAAQVATIGSKLGDLTELETEEKTNLVDAINEVKNNAKSTASEVSYIDNQDLGATNVQDALDTISETVGGSLTSTLDFSSVTEIGYYPDSTYGWAVYNNYKSKIVELPLGTKYIIVTASENYFTKMALLASGTIPTRQNEAIDYATGESSVHDIQAGQTQTFSISDDCTHIGFRTYATVDCTPTIRYSMFEQGASLIDTVASIAENTGDISEYIKKSDVVNNLDEGGVDVPLSAEQGKRIGQAIITPTLFTISVPTDAWIHGFMLDTSDSEYRFKTSPAATDRYGYIIPYDIHKGTTFSIVTGAGSTSTDIGRIYFLRNVALENTLSNYLEILKTDVVLESENLCLGNQTYSYNIPSGVDAVMLFSWRGTLTPTSFDSLSFYANVVGSFTELFDLANSTKKAIGECVGTTQEHLLLNSKYVNIRSGLSALTLLHFSDIHSDTASMNKIYEYIDEYDNYVDDVLNTGDVVKSTSENGISYYVNSGLASRTLLCVGNHDTHTGSNYGNQKSYWTGLGKSGTYDMYLADYIGNWGVTQPTGVDDSTSDYYKACYYYKDYSDAKIRLICLDVMFDDNTELAWFQQAMADTIDSSNSAYGYTVVVAAHFPAGVYDTENVVKYNGEFTTFHDYGIVHTSYQTWLTIDDSFPTAVDSFIANGGKFAAWIHGHLHTNMFFYPSAHPNILCVGIHQAGTGGTQSYWANYVGTDSDLHTCANLISIDSTNKLIKIIRLGRISDLFLRSQRVIGYDYANKKVISNY